MSDPRISVVIPVYNEEENVRPLAGETLAVLERMEGGAELLFVDDMSDDRTREVLSELQASDPRVRVIGMKQRSGQSAALWAGFQHARGSVIVTMDGDRQNDPSDIPALVERLSSCDLMCGWRVDRRDSFVKRVSSRVGNGVRTLLLGRSIHDTGCGLKAFRRECALSLTPFNGMHRFFASLAAMQGWKVDEAPVKHRPREAGRTKYGVFDRAARGLFDCLGVIWLERRCVRTVAEEDSLAAGGNREV